ncbi:hypothetical protein N234_37580 [Ralstonia pickettii DTP0602]|nr:hypothetical protein N234_37580 [Ralstonia pickettii DTP0602]
MLSALENGKGVNLEHALRVMDGLGLNLSFPRPMRLGSTSQRLMRSRSARITDALTGAPDVTGDGCAAASLLTKTEQT